MRLFRSILVIVLLFVRFSLPAIAQVVNPTGIGLRLSPAGAGITAKFFLNPRFAVEGQLNGSGSYGRSTGGQLYGSSYYGVALIEYNLIFPDPSWRIFIGPGIHAGSWDRFNHHEHELAEQPQGIFGLDATLGLEYMFKSMGLSLAVDVKPAWNLADESTFFPDNMAGFTIRYYFGHRIRVADVERTGDAAYGSPHEP